MQRFLAWLVTGPVGHLVAGVADWVILLTRYWGGRAARAIVQWRSSKGSGAST